jgi:hypothetical protein
MPGYGSAGQSPRSQSVPEAVLGSQISLNSSSKRTGNEVQRRSWVVGWLVFAQYDQYTILQRGERTVTPAAALGEPVFEGPQWTLIGKHRMRSGTRGLLASKPYSWYYGSMKTTLDLPDDLMRAVKIRAVEENRKLKDTIADLLRHGLAQGPGALPKARHRVRLPLVQCAHEARPGDEVTPERLAEILLEEEAQGVAL